VKAFFCSSKAAFSWRIDALLEIMDTSIDLGSNIPIALLIVMLGNGGGIVCGRLALF